VICRSSGRTWRSPSRSRHSSGQSIICC